MLAQTLILSTMTVFFAPVPTVPVKVPESQAPTFVYVSGVDAVRNRLYLNQVVQVPVLEERREVVTENGMQRVVTKKVLRCVERRVTRELPLTGYRFTDADGKELPRLELIKILSGGKMVVFTTDKNGVDPLYRKLLAKDALILIGK